MTLLPNRSAPPSKLLGIGEGAFSALNRKLSTGGGAAEKADEKSANSLLTAGTATGAAWLAPKADEKSPKSADVSSARGSKSSSGSEVPAELLKMSSIISLLLLAASVVFGDVPNRSSLCELRCVGELMPKSPALP